MNATHDMPEILATRNEAWGFFGTTLSNTGCSDADARDIWDDVNCELIHEFGLTSEQARDFLDSRDGRHLADAMTHDGWISGPLPTWTRRSIIRFLKPRN
jgi:hypothetical protein